MRVLHVFPTFEVGGQQMRAAALANGMARLEGMASAESVAGKNPHNLILSLNGDMGCADKFSEEVSWEAVGAPIFRSGLQQAGLIGRILAARKTIAALKPDLLLTYNWGAIEWAAANYWPLCRHVHIEDGFGREEAEGQIRRRVLFRRLVLSRQSRVAFPSHTLYDIARDIWRLPETSLHYIPNGIDLAPFGSVSREEARRTFALPGDKPVIGTLATLRPEKNLGRLLEAFHGVRQNIDCHLVIAGDGNERAGLEAHARRLGLGDAVSFPGFIKAPHTLLPAFDIFALSSDTEQMPLSIMEAMAAGLPVASLDVGDVRHMVAQENKDYISGRELPALTASLLALLGGSADRATIGAANKRLAEHEFDAEKMLSSWKDLFID